VCKGAREQDRHHQKGCRDRPQNEQSGGIHCPVRR
jgi:hypothetical protein